MYIFELPDFANVHPRAACMYTQNTHASNQIFPSFHGQGISAPFYSAGGTEADRKEDPEIQDLLTEWRLNGGGVLLDLRASAGHVKIKNCRLCAAFHCARPAVGDIV